jgi:phage terminase small subunit
MTSSPCLTVARHGLSYIDKNQILPYTTPMTHEESREKLTRVQSKFVKEYPLDFNGTEAYMRASGTTNRKSASVQAAKLMKLPKVKEAIQNYIDEALGPQTKQMLENVKFWTEVRDDPEARTADRMKASENLAKYARMFDESSTVNVTAQVQIVDDLK